MENDPRLASARLHANVEHLRSQVALSWPREREVLERVGLRNGLSILDAGSGPGYVAEDLVGRFPAATVTALDLDPHMLRLVPEHPRITRSQGSILFSDLLDETFDFALARYVFQHLAAPDLAASELHRVLKPGGIVAIIDIDDALGGILFPHLAEFEAVERSIRDTQAKSGGNREVGRHLVRLLAEAGFQDVQLEAVLLHSDQIGREPFLGQYAPDRYASTAADPGYRAAFEQLMQEPDAIIMQLIMLATGRRPTNA